MLHVNDPDCTSANLRFLMDVGLLEDPGMRAGAIHTSRDVHRDKVPRRAVQGDI